MRVHRFGLVAVVFVAAAAMLVPAGAVAAAPGPVSEASATSTEPTARAARLGAPRLTIKRLKGSKKIRASARVKAKKVEFSWAQANTRARAKTVKVRGGKAVITLPKTSKKIRVRSVRGRLVSTWNEANGPGKEWDGEYVDEGNIPDNFLDSDFTNDRDHLYVGEFEDLYTSCEGVQDPSNDSSPQVRWNDGVVGGAGLMFDPMQRQISRLPNFAGLSTPGMSGPSRASFVVMYGRSEDKFFRFTRQQSPVWNGVGWEIWPDYNTWYLRQDFVGRSAAGCPG